MDGSEVVWQTPDALGPATASDVERQRQGNGVCEKEYKRTSVTLGLFLNFSLRCLLFFRPRQSIILLAEAEP
jgi:hypothetical protein